MTAGTTVLPAGSTDVNFSVVTNTDPTVFSFGGYQIQILEDGHYLLSAKVRVTGTIDPTTANMEFFNVTTATALVADDTQILSAANGFREDLNIVAPYDLPAGTILSLRLSVSQNSVADDIYWNVTQLHGCRGPTGEIGLQGATGDQGATGETGAQGPAGGPTGEVGPTGEQGLQGLTGAQGVQGPTGAAGIQGLTGERGPTGELDIACFAADLLSQTSAVCALQPIAFAALNVDPNVLVDDGHAVTFQAYFNYTKMLTPNVLTCTPDQIIFFARLRDPSNTIFTASRAFLFDTRVAFGQVGSFNLTGTIHRQSPLLSSMVVNGVSASIGSRQADDVPFHEDLVFDSAAGLILELEVRSTMVGSILFTRADWAPVRACGTFAPETATTMFLSIL